MAYKVTVDTTVTVTMLFAPIATVGVTIPFVGEEDIVVAVVLAALDVVIGMELEEGDDVVTEVESDEDVEDKI